MKCNHEEQNGDVNAKNGRKSKLPVVEMPMNHCFYRETIFKIMLPGRHIDKQTFRYQGPLAGSGASTE